VAVFLLTAKSAVWRYEKEVRLVRNSPGILRIDPEFIEQICFGLQTPEADIELIRTLAKAHLPRGHVSQNGPGRRDFGYKRENIT